VFWLCLWESHLYHHDSLTPLAAFWRGLKFLKLWDIDFPFKL
jgi:hypothetical protein